MLKRDEINNPNSCLNKAADDEPIFVLRAQDIIAPHVLQVWLELVKNAGTSSKEKLREVETIRNKMLDWPNRKYPD